VVLGRLASLKVDGEQSNFSAVPAGRLDAGRNAVAAAPSCEQQIGQIDG